MCLSCWTCLQDISTALAVYRYMLGLSRSAGARLAAVFKSDTQDTAAQSISIWKQIQGSIRPVVEHSAFSQLFMALILVNTLAMCDTVQCTPMQTCRNMAQRCSGASRFVNRQDVAHEQLFHTAYDHPHQLRTSNAINRSTGAYTSLGVDACSKNKILTHCAWQETKVRGTKSGLVSELRLRLNAPRSQRNDKNS